MPHWHQWEEFSQRMERRGKKIRGESLESKREHIHKVPRTVTTPFFTEVAP